MNRSSLARSYSTPTQWPRRRTPPIEGVDSEDEPSTRLPIKALEEMPPADDLPSATSPEITEIETALKDLQVSRPALVEDLTERTCDGTKELAVAEILALYLRVPAIQDDNFLPRLAKAVGRPNDATVGHSGLDNLLSLLASFVDDARHDPESARFTRFALRLVRCLDDTGASQTSNELQALKQMLQEMANDPGLRAELRQECYSATEACDDRVLFHWFKVKEAWLSHGVAKGSHDADPIAVVRRARQAFRQKFFEDWVDDYVRSLKSTDGDNTEACDDIDVIEVYLAFLVELHTPLNLDSPPPQPFYGDGWRMGRIGTDSNIVQRAARELHRRENANFLRFLNAWKPMRAVLSRQFADRFEQLCRPSDASQDKAIREQLQEELIQHSLSDQVSTAELEHQVTKRKVALFDQGMHELIQAYFQAMPERLEPVWLGQTVR